MTCDGAPVCIRKPEWSDVNKLVALGHLLHRESWYAHIEYDENSVRSHFARQIAGTDEGFCRIAVKDSQIIGSVSGIKVKYWFSSEFGVFDSFIYVLPEHRGTLLAYRLWKALRDWAVQNHAAEITHGVGTAIQSKTADRFFQGVGMTFVGGIYKMRLARPAAEAGQPNIPNAEPPPSPEASQVCVARVRSV